MLLELKGEQMATNFTLQQQFIRYSNAFTKTYHS